MHMSVMATGVAVSIAALTAVVIAPRPAAADDVRQTPGQLEIIGKDGSTVGLCPLKGTKVNAQISGFGARVTVVQTFQNPGKTAIEAVYAFPLPNDAAVDSMRMKVGQRVIQGSIKRREEARQIYETARNAGKVAALLDQERPNLFTQTVANITPGASVEIEISYVQVLNYEEGQFEFNFPMVVGPRYLGNTADPGKISPPTLKPTMRTGSTIDLNVYLDAGAPIGDMTSVLHEVNTNRQTGSRAVISLKKQDEIPNRDFILRYNVKGNGVTTSLLTQPTSPRTGFFTLIFMPPKVASEDQIAPKEMIFVMDQSGSQNGFPIEKSKELTAKLIETMGPDDTFNVIGFANDSRALWDAAKPNTPENRYEALQYVKAMQANGGTELLKAVTAALTPPADPQRLRIVVFNTDGFIGNEYEVLSGVAKNRGNARMFMFGIGNSVNRFLIDGMAEEGRGDAEYVTLAEAADKAVEKFTRRVQHPLLTDITVSFDGVQVQDVYPKALPDVFSEQPVVVMGRYTNTGPGNIVVTGTFGKQPWRQAIAMKYPTKITQNPALPTLWARRKVDQLIREMRITPGEHPEAKQEEIVKLALDYGIMTEFTSFVAVEEKVVNVGGKQQTVQVPVEMASGVDMDGASDKKAFLGRAGHSNASTAYAAPAGGAVGGVSGKSTATSNVPALSQGTHKGYSLDAAEKLRKEVSPEARRGYLYEAKVAGKLQAIKSGTVAIQIHLSSWDMADIQKLKKLGFKLEGKDQGLKVLFGRVDAKKLIELAQVSSVTHIGPLK